MHVDLSSSLGQRIESISSITILCQLGCCPDLRAGTTDRNWVKLCATIVYIGTKNKFCQLLRHTLGRRYEFCSYRTTHRSGSYHEKQSTAELRSPASRVKRFRGQYFGHQSAVNHDTYSYSHSQNTKYTNSKQEIWFSMPKTANDWSRALES